MERFMTAFEIAPTKEGLRTPRQMFDLQYGDRTQLFHLRGHDKDSVFPLSLLKENSTGAYYVEGSLQERMEIIADFFTQLFPSIF